MGITLIAQVDDSSCLVGCRIEFKEAVVITGIILRQKIKPVTPGICSESPDEKIRFCGVEKITLRIAVQ